MTRATKDELLALAARVEAAQWADHVLDWQIYAASKGIPWGATEEAWARDNGRAAIPYGLPAYTASRDAAASLEPEGWGVVIDASSPLDGVEVRLMRYAGNGKVQEVEANTSGDHAEPRARTAAALRARAEELTDDR